MSAPETTVLRAGMRPFSGMSGHRVLLEDKARTGAFAAAIESVVRPGMQVLDLGTGTGVLAMIAARAGAEHVVAVDMEPLAHIARRIAADNGYEDQITFIQADSRSLDFDGRFDLIVSECMGSFFVTDEMQLAIADARRMLKPGGVFLPQRIDLFLAPVFMPQFNAVAYWAEERYGFDFGAAIEVAINQCYARQVPDSLLLGPGKRYDSIDFMEMRQNLAGSVALEVERSNTMHALCGWFDAVLTDSITLHTGPEAPPTHWAQTVFPVAPFSVAAGDTVRASLTLGHVLDALDRVRWSGAVERQGEVVHTFTHDTHGRFAP